MTSATPGGALTYTIVAANAGPDTEPYADLTDTLPFDLTCTFTSVAAGGASGNTPAGSGDLSETLVLPMGGSVTYTMSCTISPAATGTLSNTASISTYLLNDPDTSNNSATDSDTVLIPRVNLSVTKTDGVTSATPGSALTYTIVAANAGPDADPSAMLTDTLPADLTCTFTSAAAGGAAGNTAAGSGDLSETLSLPAGSSVTYTMSCTIDPAATGTLSNTASISTSGIDPDPGNNSATDSDTVLVPSVDLSVTKTDGVTSATPGGALTYTVVAANAGPSDDPAATLTDTLPADLTCTFTSAAAGGAAGNTAAGSGDLFETLSLPVGSSVTYTMSCTIDPAATGTLSNTASISTSGSDPDPSNNSATDNDAVLVPVAGADLSVFKTDGVTSATPGGALTYTIAVANAGSELDPLATLIDTLPADLTCTFTSAAAGGALGNTAAGSGDLIETLSLPVGSSVTYTMSCTIDPAAAGSLSNTATVTASVSDPVPGNNSTTDNDTLVPSADLSITKDDGVLSVTPGGTVTYTITASNLGPSAAVATVTDIFPTSLTCGWTAVALGGATGHTASGAGDLEEILTLTADSSVTYTATCTVAPDVGDTISNTAMIVTDVSDPESSNNSATDIDTVTPPVDLAVEKVGEPDPVVAGGELTYTIHVSAAAGGSSISALTITDTLPAAVTFANASGAGWSCAEAGGVVTCTRPELGQGESAPPILITVTAPESAGIIINRVTVSAAESDSDSSNNSATAETTVEPRPAADLVLTQSDSSAAVGAGEEVTYTVTVSNNGPSEAADVAVEGELSSGAQVVASSGCAEDPAGFALCGLGPIPAESAASYTLTVRAPSAAGELVHTATASSRTEEAAPGDESATESTPITSGPGAGADLAVALAGPPAAVAGEPIAYTLTVTNHGPSDAGSSIRFRRRSWSRARPAPVDRGRRVRPLRRRAISPPSSTSRPVPRPPTRSWRACRRRPRPCLRTRLSWCSEPPAAPTPTRRMTRPRSRPGSPASLTWPWPSATAATPWSPASRSPTP